jgi:hypothetical protein
MSICTSCARKVDAWIDAYQGLGPIRGWRQYQGTPTARAERSAEMFSVLVNDRAALIQRQVALIKAACNHEEVRA